VLCNGEHKVSPELAAAYTLRFEQEPNYGEVIAFFRDYHFLRLPERTNEP